MYPAKKLQEIERAFLVGIESSHDQQGFSVSDSVAELAQLADTAGAKVVGEKVVRVRRHTSAYYVGSGKAEEISLSCQTDHVNLLIFDIDLSPAQLKNLQALCGENTRVIDRTQLILDIFAYRAKSAESQLEIELAQLEYLLPRLTRQWTHLSRQEGGIGTRGPGETQLEVDRRRVQTRILKLKKDLERLLRSKTVQRKKRKTGSIPFISIIGYTNAGKTTLFNGLTGEDHLTEDRLFSTLDTTIRQIETSNGHKVLMSDTVGFLERLPHHLIASFKATLDEVKNADVLIHVIDVSDALYPEKVNSVLTILKEMDVDKPIIQVLNKIDLLDKISAIESLFTKGGNCIAVSAKEKRGLDVLLRSIDQFVRERIKIYYLFLPHNAQEALAYLYKCGCVRKKTYEPEGVYLEIELEPRRVQSVRKYIVNHRSIHKDQN